MTCRSTILVEPLQTRGSRYFPPSLGAHEERLVTDARSGWAGACARPAVVGSDQVRTPRFRAVEPVEVLVVVQAPFGDKLARDPRSMRSRSGIHTRRRGGAFGASVAAQSTFR